jgi:hypothetical protein
MRGARERGERGGKKREVKSERGSEEGGGGGGGAVGEKKPEIADLDAVLF